VLGYKLVKLNSEWDTTDSSELKAVRSWVYGHSPHPSYSRSYHKHEVGAWGPLPAMVYMASKFHAIQAGNQAALDIGCGFGTMLAFCSALGYRAFAVDFVPPDVYVGNETIRRYGINYHHLNIEASDLPFDDETFSLIVMSEVLEHFNFQPLDVLSKIRRVLRKDGLLLLTTPALGRTQKPEVYSQPFEEIPRYLGLPHDFVDKHMKIYDKAELSRLLQTAGFHSFVGLHMNPVTGIEHLHAIVTR
jgi:SAM-dependent methyltransferase